MAFESYISSKMVVIDDDTPSRLYLPNEYGRGLVARDFELYPRGASPMVEDGDDDLIPEDEWFDRAEEQERNKTRLCDLLLQAGMKIKNQKSTSYCWTFATTSAYEAVRIIQGKPYVPLSPASVGGPVTGYRNVGGYGPKAVSRLHTHGALPSSICDDTNFRCRDIVEKPENIAIAAQYKCLEFDEAPPRSYKHAVSRILQRRPVSGGYDFWGHQIFLTWMACMANRKLGWGFWNSWGYEWSDQGTGILTWNKGASGDYCYPRVAV